MTRTMRLRTIASALLIVGGILIARDLWPYACLAVVGGCVILECA